MHKMSCLHPSYTGKIPITVKCFSMWKLLIHWWLMTPLRTTNTKEEARIIIKLYVWYMKHRLEQRCKLHLAKFTNAEEKCFKLQLCIYCSISCGCGTQQSTHHIRHFSFVFVSFAKCNLQRCSSRCFNSRLHFLHYGNSPERAHFCFTIMLQYIERSVQDWYDYMGVEELN